MFKLAHNPRALESYINQLHLLPEEERVISFRQILLEQLGPEDYISWFENTHALLRGQKLTFEAKTGFAVERIERDFRQTLDQLGNRLGFSIEVTQGASN